MILLPRTRIVGCVLIFIFVIRELRMNYIGGAPAGAMALPAISAGPPI